MRRESLLAPAEEPGLWTPAGPEATVLATDGFALVVRGRRGTVEGVRLAPDGVATALARARAMAAAHRLREVVWFVGELSRPPGLRVALAGLGLESYAAEPVLTTVVIAAAPEPAPEVVVRRIDDLAGYRAGLALDDEVWGVPRAERRARRAIAAAAWEAHVASGLVEHHVAEVDGRLAGFGRLVITPDAGVLMGGSVAAWARGRGAYRALVRSRWEATAARERTRMVTAAGAMSLPILERLGFARIGQVHLLTDPAV